MTFEQVIAIASPVLAAAGAYYGALNAIRVELARLDERMEALRRNFESDHGKLDDHLTDRALHQDCNGVRS